MKDPNAVALGRKGGISKSVKKRLAAQINGRLGGRPKEKKKKVLTIPSA